MMSKIATVTKTSFCIRTISGYLRRSSTIFPRTFFLGYGSSGVGSPKKSQSGFHPSEHLCIKSLSFGAFYKEKEANAISINEKSAFCLATYVDDVRIMHSIFHCHYLLIHRIRHLPKWSRGQTHCREHCHDERQIIKVLRLWEQKLHMTLIFSYWNCPSTLDEMRDL